MQQRENYKVLLTARLGSHFQPQLNLPPYILCSLGQGHESIIAGGLISKLRGHRELRPAGRQ